jgi:quinol monooxygenase YgiN
MPLSELVIDWILEEPISLPRKTLYCRLITVKWRRPMIHVLAVITAKAGQREAILKEFRANMPAVRAENGCIEYGPAVDADGVGGFQTKFGADTFVVIEKWESLEALKAHAAAPHMAAYAARTKEMIQSRIIHVLTPADR